ncbi:MAG: hypothetical protein K6G71_04160 [Clostridiales bacterium]|nr:hypothetical protein [Clostridiales bacterium]
MKDALIFNKDGSKILVSADQIKNGQYSPKDFEFINPDYEFKVQYVSGAKNNGGPYFRLYYSYEDYKKLFPDSADRYAIIANMRRYDESKWHKVWKEKVSEFCEIEKHIKDSVKNKWKRADAFNIKTNTCIEFQHSYIDFDFEERNSFYSKLGINIVWLYDLTKSSVQKTENGEYEILEDNARGFFRISENPDNLRNYPVYFQVKSGMIYRISELYRRETHSDLKSTIRYFKPEQILTEDQFIDFIRSENPRKVKLQTLSEIWKPQYKWIVVLNSTTQKTIRINHDKKGNMYRSFDSGLIQYKYVTCHGKNNTDPFTINSSKDYSISNKDANSRIWNLLKWKYANNQMKTPL